MTTDAQSPSADLLLSIGGVVGHLRLDGARPAFLAEVRQRYAAFMLPCSPDVPRAFTLRLLMRGRAPTPLDLQRQADPPAVRTTATAVDVDRADFRARLKLKPGGPFEGTGHCRATPVAVESLLRILWSVFLPRAGGALFHACGFSHDGGGVLALGPSGAGKTTLARKLPDPDQVLSDEVVAVHRDGGAWRISGTPFFGEWQRSGVSMQSWSLSGLAFLEKRASVEAHPVAQAESVLRLLECLLCFQTDPETVQQNFALAIELGTAVPAFVCASRADTPFAEVWRAMRPLLQGGDRAPGNSPRELISALRANLTRHGSYAFQPQGTSMRPWLRSGDSLFVEAAEQHELFPGDVVLYWRAGRSPERDRLICHRVVGRRRIRGRSRVYAKGDALGGIETFDDGREATVIGRVRSISRGGEIMPVPGRMGSMAILVGSLMMMPLMKLMARG